MTTGEGTTGEVTTGEVTTGEVTTGEVTTGPVTTGVVTTGPVTTGPTTGIVTTGPVTTGVVTTGALGGRLPASWIASRVPCSLARNSLPLATAGEPAGAQRSPARAKDAASTPVSRFRKRTVASRELATMT